MAAVSILAVLVFSTVLSIIEIPEMLRDKSYKELTAFCMLLALGTFLVVFKSLNLKIPNPSDWVAWVYSPISEIMKSLLK